MENTVKLLDSPSCSTQPIRKLHSSLYILPPTPSTIHLPDTDVPITDSAATSSPPHLISASFFNPIDPFHPSRLSTLHLIPQYTFPSSLNFLPRGLETPFALNHHTLSFYWNRSDALTDSIYNIWAQPPCMNCVVACQGDEDGDLARRCDFGARRDESFGKVRACGRCVIKGNQGKCVEMIEVRHDGSVSAQEGDFAATTELGGSMWSERERRLRRQGLVDWRPINLYDGDVDGKIEVLEMWNRLRECPTNYVNTKNWLAPIRKKLTWRENIRAVARARSEARQDAETAEAKKARLEKAAARVAGWDLEDAYLDFKASETIPEPPEAEKMADESHDAIRRGVESMLANIADLEVYIADQKRYWHNRVCAESVHLYNAKVAQDGVKAAVEMEVEWEEAKSQVLPEMEDLLDHVLRGRANEVKVSDFEELSQSTRTWLDLLVPRIWDALAVAHVGKSAPILL
jgi:hypothetical protein